MRLASALGGVVDVQLLWRHLVVTLGLEVGKRAARLMARLDSRLDWTGAPWTPIGITSPAPHTLRLENPDN